MELRHGSLQSSQKSRLTALPALPRACPRRHIGEQTAGGAGGLASVPARRGRPAAGATGTNRDSRHGTGNGGNGVCRGFQGWSLLGGGGCGSLLPGLPGGLLLPPCAGELSGSAGSSSPVEDHSHATGAANPRAPSQDRAKTADDLIRSQHARMVLPDRVVIQVQSRWGAPAELLPILSDIVLRGISRFAGSSNALVSWVPPLTTDKIAPVFRGSFRFTSLNQRLEPLRSIRSAADGPQRVLGAHDHGSRGDSRSGHQRLVHHVLRHELEGGSGPHHEDVAVLAG